MESICGYIKMYKQAKIYFWSGTGNSYRVAKWFESIAGDRGVEIQLLSLDAANLKHVIPEEEAGFISIVFPTHGFTAPWHVIRSVWKLPDGHGLDAFCVATRAGLKFGPFFLPGISGNAMFVVAIMLIIKGYKVGGTMSVDMPSNWYSLHPIQGQKSLEAIISRAESKVAGFMEKVLSQSRVWFTPNNLYEIVLGALLFPLSVAYLLFGRFFLAKLFFANNRCNGCGICAQHCPVNAIWMKGTESPIPFWRYNCESCMRCAGVCTQNAIEAGHSWGVLLYLITSLPLSYYLFSLLGMAESTTDGSFVEMVGSILDLLFYFPAIFLSYYIFSQLIKIPAINYVFTHTTMTHLPFWGRYREPKAKLKDFS